MLLTSGFNCGSSGTKQIGFMFWTEIAINKLVTILSSNFTNDILQNP